jgi:hypothetical protein
LAVSSFYRIFAGKTRKQPNYDYQQSSHRENVNKCYRGGKSLRFTFLLTLALTAFASCSEDTPVATDYQTRTTPPAADSTSVITMKADSAWADTIDVSFDPDTADVVTITVPDSITSKSCEFAASRRQ